MKQCPICDNHGCSISRTINNINLVLCNRCEFVYADLSDELILHKNSAYDEEAESFYCTHQTDLDRIWFKQTANRLVKLSGLSGGKVLDVGCGNGVLLNSFPSHWQRFGLDLSPWAKRAAAKYHFHLFSKDLIQANLISNSFDIITSSSTFEHIPRPKEHLVELFRALKPGGILYISAFPNYRSLSIRLGISAFASNTPPDHCNYFSRKSLINILSATNIDSESKYTKIKTYGVPELHRLYRFLNRKVNKTTSTKVKTCTKPSNNKLLSIALLAYLAPFPFSAGDKFELIAVKKQK